jgi:tetratricopeptide (TPR) repeat protein
MSIAQWTELKDKPQLNLNVISFALLFIWLFARWQVAAIDLPVAIVIDFFVAWLVLPRLCYVISILCLSSGLDSSASKQQTLFQIGLFLNRIATVVDDVNALMPGNILCQGSANRKMMVGALLHAMERKEAARKFISELLKELQAHPHPENLKARSQCLLLLTEIFQSDGKYVEARDYANRALALIEDSDEDGITKGSIFVDLCGNYIKQGLIEESIKLGQKAVASLDSSNAGHNQLQGIAYNNLSLAYSYAGEYNEALNCAKRSFNLKKAASPQSNNLSLAVAHSNIADYYLYLERYDEAYAEARTAYDMLKELGFSEHEVTATVQQNLGAAHLGLGQVAEAKAHLLAALNGKKKHMAVKDPEWATFYLDLAKLYAALNEHGTADSYFAKSIDLAKNNLGEQHPRLGYVYTQYAKYLDKLDRTVEAEEAKIKAKAISDYQKIRHP